MVILNTLNLKYSFNVNFPDKKFQTLLEYLCLEIFIFKEFRFF